MFKSLFNKFKNLRLAYKIIGGIIFVAVIVGGLLSLVGLVVMSLWNWLMPEIFGLPQISMIQAMGLLLLFSIFKGVVSSSSSSSKSKNNSQAKVNLKGQDVTDLFKSEDDKYDEKYEKWWDEKGEEAFESYLEKDQS